jgi:hypothetical protein
LSNTRYVCFEFHHSEVYWQLFFIYWLCVFVFLCTNTYFEWITQLFTLIISTIILSSCHYTIISDIAALSLLLIIAVLMTGSFDQFFQAVVSRSSCQRTSGELTRFSDYDWLLLEMYPSWFINPSCSIDEQYGLDCNIPFSYIIFWLICWICTNI